MQNYNQLQMKLQSAEQAQEVASAKIEAAVAREAAQRQNCAELEAALAMAKATVQASGEQDEHHVSQVSGCSFFVICAHRLTACHSDQLVGEAAGRVRKATWRSRNRTGGP